FVILRGANPPYRIVCGFRRISSLKMLGVRAVNAITGNFSHEEALTLAILENEMRKSFCDLDRAFGIRKLLESGKDLNDVSHIFKIKRRRIFQLKSLVNFPKNILNALAEKRISTHHALILKRAAEKFPEISFAEWIEKIQRENMPVRKLGDAIRKTLEERKRFPKIINREPDELFNEDELTGGESHLLKFNFRSIDLKKLSKREQESYSASLRRLAQIIENFSEPGADFRFLPVSGRNGVHPGALRKNGTK
ncbi:MAG: ParB/RepB/Spo0J family partition protein, partial [Deltaproteobacteria bacterium]|nr:ParB/RepB/Spo0J family partition protein [Deltaproteobacteria bacterium]